MELQKAYESTAVLSCRHDKADTLASACDESEGRISQLPRQRMLAALHFVLEGRARTKQKWCGQPGHASYAFMVHEKPAGEERQTRNK